MQTRAALVGLDLSPLLDGAWRLTYAAFGSAGHVTTVPHLRAAESALMAFEQVHAEMLALVNGMRGAR